MSLLRHIWCFRELLIAISRREVIGRYRGSFLGRLWLILQPLAFLGIYIIVFQEWFRAKSSAFADNDAGFPMVMLAGLLPWLTVSEVVTGGVGVVPRSASLIRRYAFPTEILPVQVVMVGVFNLVVSLSVFTLLVGFFLGRWPMHLEVLPVLILSLVLYLLGLVYLLSALYVFIKDIGNILPMLMTGWFFLSPIFLLAKAPTEMGSELTAKVLSYNPLTYLIGALRDIFIWRAEDYRELGMKSAEELARIKNTLALSIDHPGSAPWSETGTFALIAVITFILGYAVFMRLKPGFSDEI